MAGLYFNDGHYAGPELGSSVYLLAGAPSPLVSLWSLLGLSLATPGLVGASDLLALVALRLSGSGPH